MGLSKYKARARWADQISSPFSGHDLLTIFVRNLWTAHVHLCELRRSFSPVAGADDRSQLMTLHLLAHAACPQQNCPLFLSHSRSLYATCDIHRFVACGRCLKAWPCQIGGERTTEGRWTSFRTHRFGASVCDVFRRFSERPFASEPARHAAEPSIAAANGVSEDCENGSSLPPREAAHCCRAW